MKLRVPDALYFTTFVVWAMCRLMYTNCQRLSCPLLWLAELAHMSSSWPITGSGQLRRRESVRRRSNTKYCEEPVADFVWYPGYRSQYTDIISRVKLSINSGEPDGGVYQNCMFWDYSYTATSNAARDFSCTNAFYYPFCQIGWLERRRMRWPAEHCRFYSEMSWLGYPLCLESGWII